MVKVNIKNLMKYPLKASKELGNICIYDDEDINDFIEEVMTCNEEVNVDEPLGRFNTINET